MKIRWYWSVQNSFPIKKCLPIQNLGEEIAPAEEELPLLFPTVQQSVLQSLLLTLRAGTVVETSLFKCLPLSDWAMENRPVCPRKPARNTKCPTNLHDKNKALPDSISFLPGRCCRENHSTAHITVRYQSEGIAYLKAVTNQEGTVVSPPRKLQASLGIPASTSCHARLSQRLEDNKFRYCIIRAARLTFIN